jgi:hypothetical protein
MSKQKKRVKKQVEPDSSLFFKARSVSNIIGAQWVRIESLARLERAASCWIYGLGLFGSRSHDHFSMDRKIEYALSACI